MKQRRALLGLTWKALLGGLAACLATILGSLAGKVLAGANSPEIAEHVALVAYYTARFAKPDVPLLTQPVLETFLFLLAFKLLAATRMARERTTTTLGMTLIMGTVGWLLHDANGPMVAQSFGFAVLGALFAALWFQSGGVVAFVGTALAHMIWNVSVLTLALIYSPRVVWESRVQNAGSDGARVHIVGDFETADQCRRAGLFHLQRLQVGQNAEQHRDAPSRMTCQRAIRSRW